MINNLLKNNFHILICFLSILSIYIGFFLDENITIGPKLDWEHALAGSNEFQKNFKYTLLNYDKALADAGAGTRISPIYLIIIFILKKILIDVDLVRFFLMNIIILNQLFFYKSLRLVFKENINKKYLLILSCILYLSPSFRSNAVWPESAMLGLLFFLISTYFFLKFKVYGKIKYSFLNILFLAIASYIRPSFCLFGIFFYYEFLVYFFKNRNFLKNIFCITLLNLFLAFPAYYYIFILDIFFIEAGGLSSNYFNKIPIITSIIIFHMLPILIYKKFNLDLNFKYDLGLFLIIILSLTLIIENFNYNINFSGGGIILHASNYLLGNNILLFICYPALMYFLIKISIFKSYNNLILILILLMMTPQYHIFHKYYDPLVIILCFTVFNLEIKYDFFQKKRYLFILYSFYILYYFVHYINYLIESNA
ncbi:hypothetical protein IDH15_00120 [Pelagibacterales bacterium SAG-MED38]|nr:hypothetical protein [Pelagibacterales bacterium SAG-MED38]